MRKLNITFILLVLAVATSLHADGKQQSYFTYDDGGTIVKQGDDGREVEARVNLPIFPGDEVTTSRRGRSEIRLSDGNIIALDRSTSILFRSILDSYDGDNSQTVAELHYGHVMVERNDNGNDLLRLDTESASYVATDEAVYAVEADGQGKDRVTVFSGNIEARTPNRTQRIRSGEEAHIDGQGIYGLVSLPRNTSDDFERWYLRRAEIYNRAYNSKYLDHSLAYYDSELSSNGSWVYVDSYGSYCWRPSVGVGWRPYYSGHWASGPSGCLTWVSYEPWGWVPYHYGRWGYDPGFGWVWLPGSVYSPAWVYWMYGSGYVGWAPSGFYDCYRPYYNWAYRPYARAEFGFGFNGHIKVGEVDLRPWTFVNPNVLVSNRVDRAALTTDAIRERLSRNGSATVSSTPARFTRSELKDPAAAVGNIVRRGIGSGTGNGGSGSQVDMTPFFRRDPELPNSVRDRIVRTRPADGPATVTSGRNGVGSGVPTVGTPGTIEGRVGRPVSGSPKSDTPGEVGSTIDRGTGTGAGNISRDWRRDGGNPAPSAPTQSGVDRSGSRGTTTPPPDSGTTSPAWRDRIDRGTPRNDKPVDRSTTPPPARVERPSTPRNDQPMDRYTPPPSRDENWRGRAVGRGGDVPRSTIDNGRDNGRPAPIDRGSDVPRRVIDGIGGARVYHGDSPNNSGSSSSGTSRPSYTPPPRVERSSPPPQRNYTPPPAPAPRHESPPPQRHNDSGSSSSSSGSKSSSSHENGGHVHREH